MSPWQKAPTAAFFSNTAAASDLLAVADSGHWVLCECGAYIPGNPSALADGDAFSDRPAEAIAAFFPDGIDGNANDPSVSRSRVGSIRRRSAARSGRRGLVQHVTYVSGAVPMRYNCTPSRACPTAADLPRQWAVYRDGVLIGGVGVSGDGVDQDDMIAFLGPAQRRRIACTINNARPPSVPIRSSCPVTV